MFGINMTVVSEKLLRYFYILKRRNKRRKPQPDEPNPQPPILFRKFNIILRLPLGVPALLGFLPETLYTHFSPIMCYMPCPSHPP
jgi:hypothetical protein